MITIASPVASRNRNPFRIGIVAALSLVLHLCLISILLIHPIRVRPRAEVVRLPGTDQGTHSIVAYLPGKVAHYSIASTAPQVQAVVPTPNKLPAPRPLKSEPTATTHPSDTPNALSGEDARGTGKIDIASTTFSPSPRPDLSTLPRGTHGDVILDITIDSTGKVSDIKMTSGLGHGVDETVIATVQQWTFHPATKDGQPIASEQEIHFHYEVRG